MTAQRVKENSVVLEKPTLAKATFIDFKIDREEWNKYRLPDQILLRAKFVLKGVLMEKSLERHFKDAKSGEKVKPRLGFNFSALYAVEAPPKSRGTPDSKKYSHEELAASIIENEVDFETVKATWNSYLFENGIRMKVRLSPISIRKTSKCDGDGMPIYLVDSGVDAKIKLPERLKKSIATRTKVKKSKKL